MIKTIINAPGTEFLQEVKPGRVENLELYKLKRGSVSGVLRKVRRARGLRQCYEYCWNRAGNMENRRIFSYCQQGMLCALLTIVDNGQVYAEVRPVGKKEYSTGLTRKLERWKFEHAEH